MKRLGICILVWCSVLLMQAQSSWLLSRQDIDGTARYVGMSGAMTAVGGDPSAVRDNPAGLAVYRRMEMQLTAGALMHRMAVKDGQLKTNQGVCNQFSWVFAFGHPERTTGIVQNNVMLSYNRLATYDRALDFAAKGQLSSERVQVELEQFGTSYQYGSADEYGLDWAMNISHRWMLGVGVRMQSYSYNEECYFDTHYHTQRGDEYLRTRPTAQFSGLGVRGAFGVLLRPLEPLRIGLSVETPSYASIQLAQSLYAGTNEGETVHDLYYPSFVAPWHGSLGVAWQWRQSGLLSLQYDFRKAATQDVDWPMMQSIRLGFESAFAQRYFVNLGYALSLADVYEYAPSHTAGAAFGYRGRVLIAQVAYQYKWQQVLCDMSDLEARCAAPSHTHNIRISLGWRI